MVGSGVLGRDVGLTELFPVSPQVMETRQVPRSPRVRLLLLLLLLVPWGDRTASGVALPPSGVLRYVRHPGHPGRGGIRRGGNRPKEKGAQRPEREEDGDQGWREVECGQGISTRNRHKKILKGVERF